MNKRLEFIQQIRPDRLLYHKEACPVFTCPVSSPSHGGDTYSADFQKCPGWDSLRLSLGSFSSMSASWVNVGLSLWSNAQQAERISCGQKSDQWLMNRGGGGLQKPPVRTHRDLLAQVDFSQNVPYPLSAPHLPDGSFHRLVGDWPIPRLEFIPNCS